MKINHVISSITRSSGGPSTYIKYLIEALDGKVEQELISFDGHGNIPIQAQLNLMLIKINKSSAFYSKSMKMKLLSSSADVFHGNGIWQYPVHQMAKVARQKKIPYIISPHGMLEPWSLKQGKWKKQLAMAIFQKKDLQHAACLHATALMEVINLRKLGFKNPIAVIPNGVPLEQFELKDFNTIKASKKVLFLSRIHPKKGIELLIEAWHQLPNTLTQDWSVDIIGNGEPEYIENLIKKIAQKGLSESIQIKKPIDGKKKIEAYQNAKLFVLPTYSENFGIVVAEALACGTPVITTKGTPWEDLETYKCGWWVNVGVDALTATLEKVLLIPEEQWVQMGKNGRQLIENKYSMKAVGEQMYDLYQWIAQKKELPAFVQIN